MAMEDVTQPPTPPHPLGTFEVGLLSIFLYWYVFYSEQVPTGFGIVLCGVISFRYTGVKLIEVHIIS